jgi:hypothetical protein
MPLTFRQTFFPEEESQRQAQQDLEEPLPQLQIPLHRCESQLSQ